MNDAAASTPAPDREAVHAETRFLKGALPADGGRVPFLLRLEGSLPEQDEAVRTPIDLALVLDRSGSMNGEPLAAAKLAAHDAVDLLEDGDRVAIVIFDDAVEVLVPTTPVDDRAALHDRIERIACGGTTALHAGWVEGAERLVDLLDPARTARVVLLTDGQANVGVVRPDEIAADVARMAAHGVATSAIGLGRNFNEDLLARVAEAGRGRFQHAETPAELEGVMAAELIGIDATVARRVRARFAADGVAAEVVEVLNDVVTDGESLVLPDLVAEMPVTVAGILHVRPAKPHLERTLGTVELSWTDVAGQRRSVSIGVAGRTLTSSEYAAAPEDPDVATAVAVLTAARHRVAAMQALARFDDRAVETELSAAEAVLAAAPDGERVQRERASLERVRQALRDRDRNMARKRMTAQHSATSSDFDHEMLMRSHRFATKQEALDARRSERTFGEPEGGRRTGAHRAAHAGEHGLVGPGDGAEPVEIPRAGGGVGTLRLRTGDITAWRGEAIVNPTNPAMHGSGASVDGAVHRVGGMELTRECRSIGHVGLGQAVATRGWNLPADYVLHTAVPTFDGSEKALELLAACYRAAFELAAQLRLSRVAVPAMGSGSNRFPKGPAARVAIREVLDALGRDGDPREIDIVLFDDATHRAFERTLRQELVGRRIASPAA